MNALLNIIWLLFCGIGLALGWVCAGILCIFPGCFLLMFPFAGACFELAGQTLMPFGKVVIERKHIDSEAKPKPIASTIWLIFSGIWLFIGYIMSGLLMICTVIGIPVGLQCFKIAQVGLNPYKYTLIDKKMLNALNK